MYIILNNIMSVDCRSTVLEYCGGGGEEDDRTATGRGTVFGALGGRGGFSIRHLACAGIG